MLATDRDGVEPLAELLPQPGDLQPAAEGCEHREHRDGPRHRPRSLPVLVAVTVLMLVHERGRLAEEDDEEKPERVDPGQQRPQQPRDVQNLAITSARQGRRQDRVLREEARQRRDADERERADQEGDERLRHHVAHAAHPPDVLLVREAVDDEAGGEEEQRLEVGVRHQVEHPAPVRPEPGAEEHVADLRHRRIRDHALDVRLHERDEAGDEQRDRTEPGGEVGDRRRLLEDRVRPSDQVDAGGDHRRGVDQGRDRRGALHRVREPGVDRDLGGLRDRAAQQAEGDEVDERLRHAAHLCEDAREVERAGLPDQHEEGERHRRVAERVHHEGLLRGRDGLRPLVPEADQEIRGEADEAPACEQEQEVPRLDEQQHREDEERHVGEVAPLLGVVVHVADRVEDDQAAHAGDDQHHRDRERVDEQRQPYLEVACGEPGPRGRDRLALLRFAAQQADERRDRAAEGGEDGEGRDPAGRAPRDRTAEERDRQRSCQGREQAQPGAEDHPLSTRSRSTSRSRRLRAIATISPRPTTTSDAATAITASAKTCPS